MFLLAKISSSLAISRSVAHSSRSLRYFISTRGKPSSVDIVAAPGLPSECKRLVDASLDSIVDLTSTAGHNRQPFCPLISLALRGRTPDYIAGTDTFAKSRELLRERFKNEQR